MTCPICGKAGAEKYRPFCSRRCADIDLGRWLTEGYALPGETEEQGKSEDDSPAISGPDRNRRH